MRPCTWRCRTEGSRGTCRCSLNMDKNSRGWEEVVRREAIRKGSVYPWNLLGCATESYRPQVTAGFPSVHSSLVEDLSKASTADFLGASPSPPRPTRSSPQLRDHSTSPDPPQRDQYIQTSERQQLGSLSHVLGADSCYPQAVPVSAKDSSRTRSFRSKSFGREEPWLSQRYLKDPAEGSRLQQTLSAADLLESDKSKPEDLEASQSLRSALEFLQMLSGEATTEKLQSRLEVIESRFGTKGKTKALQILKDLAREPLSATYSDQFSRVVSWTPRHLPQPAFGTSWNEDVKSVTATLGTFLGAVHQLRDDLADLRSAADHIK